MGNSTIGKKLHAEVLALRLAGESGRAIAAKIGKSATAVNGFLSKPETKARLRAMEDAQDIEIARQVGRELVAASRPSVRWLVKVVKGKGKAKDATVAERTTAANSVLDRSGHGKGAKVEHSGAIAQPAKLDLSTCTREQLRTLRKGGDVEVVPGEAVEEDESEA